MSEELVVLSLFSGIGAPEVALKNLGIPYKLYGFSEIDKYAIKSYCAIHDTDPNLNLGDITEIDISSLPTEGIDLIFHGSPCQDFSVAGKGQGAEAGSGTRSSLMWNTVEIVSQCKPKYVIWENVKNVLSKKHRHNFDKYMQYMRDLGYKNKFEILNAKHYGVPQNRERVFVVSILEELNQDFQFPIGKALDLRLKDILEENIPDSFYISDEKVKVLMKNIKDNVDLNKPVIGTCHKRNDLSKSTRDLVYNVEQPVPTITSTIYKDLTKILQLPCIGASRGRNPNNPGDRTPGDPHLEQRLEINTNSTSNTISTVQKDNYVVEAKRIGGLFDNEKGKHQAGSVWDKDGISPTLDTMQGGYRQPCVLEDSK